MTDGETIQQQSFMPSAVGAYRIESELGSGAMGAVFRAVHARLDRAVALKVMRPDLLQDADSVRRFLREARSIAKLEHPNIVAVYDAGEVDGIYYIAMKLLQGETLQALLAREGRLPVDRAVAMTAQLCSALDYAHRQGVVHRDVKPANVMVDGDTITLTDFSIAQALNPGATRSVTISGTPLYMSPEQIRGQASDSRSDIYSLGVLLYEMLTGRPPFEGQMVSVMYSHLHDPIPDPRASAPSIPDALADVIERAMSKDPESRFQTAGEMLDALSAAAPLGRSQDLGPTRPGALFDQVTVVLPGEADLQATQVLTNGARSAQPPTVAPEALPRSRPSVPRGVLIALAGALAVAVVAAALFYLRGQPARVASLVITTDPAGASVRIDGTARGSAPLSLPNLSAGRHVVAATLPSYSARATTIDVKGGSHGAVNLVLPSWPLSRLVTVDKGLLTYSYTRVPGTGRWVVGASISIVSARSIAGRRVYAVAEFRVSPALPRTRALSLRPSFALYGPGGTSLGSFPSTAPLLKMDRGHSVAVFASGFQLNPRGPGSLPSGTYQVQLLVNGYVMKTLRLVLR